MASEQELREQISFLQREIVITGQAIALSREDPRFSSQLDGHLNERFRLTVELEAARQELDNLLVASPPQAPVPSTPLILQDVPSPVTPAPFANLDEQLEGLNLFSDPVDDTVQIPFRPEEEIQQPLQTNTNQGLSSISEFDARTQATAQDQVNFEAREDWRVRLALSPGATYLYRSSNPGILSPLANTDGVVFPYTPQVSVQYSASYESQAITHSNYLIQNYRNSSVDSVAITADFTAQDTAEANYLLAVIHFFRSVTKMFYGQDQYPKNGTPPPLVYLYGLGGFQFEAHPLAVTNFQYNLPNDVDYIKTTTAVNAGEQVQTYSTNTEQNARLTGTGAERGGVSPRAKFTSQNTGSTTYVPTKISMIINFVPIISRNAISNQFSLTEYGTGKLLQGTRNPNGGFW